MLVTMRTFLIIVFGVAIGFGLYVAADSLFGEMVGPNGMSDNYAALISTWRGLGGTAAPLGGESDSDAGPMGGAGFGGGQFGRAGGRRSVPITSGLHLSSAPGQTGSDLMWLGIPAVGAVVFEIGWTALTRRRRKTTT
jgi:hypothetical protein